jgi:hypothetical protein
MATYKVIQDIEAEDKLIWQLSFRQFVYALIAAIFLYVSYLFVYNGVWFMSALTLPVALFTGFLAYPFGKDQPTEVWALARLRFLIKPRRRIWAQSGLKELVSITVPKRVEINRTDGLSQAQVKSRLQALADTIDSRGWTVKDIDDTYQGSIESDSDRLISSSTLPSNVPDDLLRANDILDVKDNPIAQKMDELLTNNANRHRQALIDDLDKMREEESIKRDGRISPPASVSTASHSAYSLSTTAGIQKQTKTASTAAPTNPAKSTAEKDPDIINLARRNDLNVSVIGREINRARGVDLGSSDNEVTVSLR